MKVNDGAVQVQKGFYRCAAVPSEALAVLLAVLVAACLAQVAVGADVAWADDDEDELVAGSLWTGAMEEAANGHAAGSKGAGALTFSGDAYYEEGDYEFVDDRPTIRASFAVFPFVPNPTTDMFIKSIAEGARDIGQKDGLYASVMIAQAILESGSGSSGLSKPPYNNLFGIKGSYKGKSVALLTSEDDGTGHEYDIVAPFRRYPSVRESLQDYADLLKRDMAAFYAPVWKQNAKTYVQACNYLQGHYATDTTYAGKLKGIIIAYDLTQYDHPAKKAESPQNKDERLLELLRAVSESGAYITSAAVLSAEGKRATSERADGLSQARTQGKVSEAEPASAHADESSGSERGPISPFVPVAVAVASVAVGFAAKSGAALLPSAIKALPLVRH